MEKLSASRGGIHNGRWALCRGIKSIFIFTIFLLVLLDSLMLLVHRLVLSTQESSQEKKSFHLHEKDEMGPITMNDRLLDLAANSLAQKDFKQDEMKQLWEEPYSHEASKWKPCAYIQSPKDLGPLKHNKSGYILVSANGGLNQQRVAVCNAVAVASLLNATLVIPKFLYSNVWKDRSQFEDIYQEEHFMQTLKDDINIIKDLPLHLKLLDLETAKSVITDADISKEAKAEEYLRTVLPLLQRNGVVHFLGFGNRLGFHSLPPQLQRLRCKCNFHALKFVHKIQETASLLVTRIRKHTGSKSMLDKQLLGEVIANDRPGIELRNTKYLALHLRFEIDMLAYSMCEFGGGESETRALKSYREAHFPLLLERLKKSRAISPKELRSRGRCPLTPEEAALVLASLGFKGETYIYLAGSNIYGGESRMKPLTSLYPNLVTKENLLSPSELAPFRNHSSQLAALDFIACATADVFAITDSGSQFSSLVSGFRTYYGSGHAPTLRPSKKRLAAILLENKTIDWSTFTERIRRMIDEGQTLVGLAQSSS
ncbi:unnamed protein product, partial [Cuscuta epithymum]